MDELFLGLGSNLGDRLDTLRLAASRLVELLHEGQGRPRVSGLYETTAIGGPATQGDFLNAVVGLDSTKKPNDILTIVLAVETEFGRQRLVPCGPRTLDVDILLIGDLVLNTPDLIVPHPRMHLRRFVLEPLIEIAGYRRHPVSGKTFREHLGGVSPVVVSGSSATVKLVSQDWFRPNFAV